MSNNVFKFPEHKIVREVPPQIEEIEKAKEKGKQNYAEDIINDFAESMLGALDSYGIDQDGRHFDKDLSFAVEAIRAMIYRSLGLEHHLHDFVDTHVSVLKRDKNGNLILEAPENVEEMEEIIIAELEKVEAPVDTDK
jgi:hypothetical protein